VGNRFSHRPLWTDNLLAKRRRGRRIAHGPTDAAAERDGSNVVECAAILMEFAAAPHERWAKLAKRILDTEHAGDDTTHVSVVS
jgi:hypothetical protein